jgi:hypothetical protein
MRPHRQLLIVAALGFLLAAAQNAGAATEVYDVNAWIDTTDYLIVHGSTLQWEHNISGSPAGTHLGPQATIISSSLDGVTQMSAVNWNQMWPSPLPPDAFSSTFSPLTPSLPSTGGLFASVTKVSGRGTPSIFQQPSGLNDYTLIVQFTDGFNGADFLDAQITVGVPEPASLTLIAAAGSFLLRRRNRSRRRFYRVQRCGA